MSACAIKRWGTGTPCVRETTTPAAKEMATKLAQMRAERERQDTMWNENLSSEKCDQPPSQGSPPQKERKQ